MSGTFTMWRMNKLIMNGINEWIMNGINDASQKYVGRLCTSYSKNSTKKKKKKKILIVKGLQSMVCRQLIEIHPHNAAAHPAVMGTW